MQAVRIIDNVVEVEVALDTAAYAANDVLFQPVELPNIVNQNGVAVVTSIVLTDFDDNGSAIDLVFLRQVVTVGATNATMAIHDTQVQHVLGHIRVLAAEYLNLDQNQVATTRSVGLVLLPDPSAGQSVWMAGRATADQLTYASGRMLIKVGVLRG